MLRGPIIVDRFDGDVFETQRRLRSSLLDNAAIRHNSSRDLAAHMLLYLDDLPMCWSIATHWLRKELGCHRVDTGFGSAQAEYYYPGFAEAKHNEYDIPSFGSAAVYNFDPGMQALWLGERPVIFADIKQDKRVSQRLRIRMSGAGTQSKFGCALRTQHGSYGLICADWTQHLAPNKSDLFDCFEHTATDVLSPIIAIAKQIADEKKNGNNSVATGCVVQDSDRCRSDPMTLDTLTESENEVARLVVRGLSYKEIARIRGRSFSTIDHQLRSIRRKLSVSSTAELVSLLAKKDHTF
ncbi:MAG: helix-turn-helix transcriptional regulator [Granulosicoccus sp.]